MGAGPDQQEEPARAVGQQHLRPASGPVELQRDSAVISAFSRRGTGHALDSTMARPTRSGERSWRNTLPVLHENPLENDANFSANMDAGVDGQPQARAMDAEDDGQPQARAPIKTDPKTVLLIPQSLTQAAYTRVFFSIRKKLDQPLSDAGNFFIRVTSPTRYNPIVNVEEDHYHTRLICSFYTTEPGPHQISVGLEDVTKHIQGSPVFVTINRDTVLRPSRTTMTRILTAGRIEQDVFGLAVSGTSKIWGVTSDPDNEQIYAADGGGHEVLVFCTITGNISLEVKFAAPVPVNGLPFRPTGIHFCRVHKLLYVTDRDNDRVCIFERNGRFVSSFGSNGDQDGQFKSPWGVAVSPDGELIAVADSQKHCIQLFHKSGLFMKKYILYEVDAQELRDGLEYPRGVCFNSTGSAVLVSDSKLKNVIVVQLLHNQGAVIPQHDLNHPQGISLDPAGNLVICEVRDNGRGAIRVILPNGTLIATVEGTTDSRFQEISDVAVCRRGSLCVVDCDGTRLQIF